MESALRSVRGMYTASPAPRAWAGELAWVLFVVVQALDGVLSYVGVSTFGPWVEGNPLVAWYIGHLGPALAFLSVKLFAVGCGTVLYVMSRHGILAALTLVYVWFAVGPWLQVLST